MIFENLDPQGLLRFAQSAEGKQDPHLVYDALRRHTPVWRDEDSGFYYILSWNACEELLRSEDYGAPKLLKMEPRFERSPSLRFLADTLSNLDAPDHTRLRRGIQRSFSTPVLRRSEQTVRDVIQAKVDGLKDQQAFDLVNDFAAAIPNTIICEMLGVPQEDHVRFGGWLADQFRLLGPSPPADELLDEVDSSTQSLLDYMSELIEERRRQPQSDIISELVIGQAAAEEPMTVREMTVTSAILLAGGSDTTKTAITMGMHLLLSNPAQAKDYVEHPELERPAFEEILRLGGAVLLANLRRARVDVVLEGHTIPSGALLVPVLASANVDPLKFDDPLEFNIRRSPNRHLAFGGGAHVCVGNMMARMVGPAAITALMRNFPDLRLAQITKDVNLQLPALRGLNSLQVVRTH